MLSFGFYVFSARAIAWKRSSTGKNTAFTGPEHYLDISEAKRCNISIPKLVS